jgi:hypothetical protein
MCLTLAHRLRRTVPLLMSLMMLQGCLKVAEMEVRVRPRANGSVAGEVIYRGLYSSLEEDSVTVAEDYQTLVDDYLEGDALEADLPDWKLLKRELFEEQGKLCGRLLFEAASAEAVGLFRDKTCSCAAWILVPQDGDLGTLTGGDGTRTPYGMRWGADRTELRWIQKLDVIESNDRSLLPAWREAQTRYRPSTARPAPRG